RGAATARAGSGRRRSRRRHVGVRAARGSRPGARRGLPALSGQAGRRDGADGGRGRAPSRTRDLTCFIKDNCRMAPRWAERWRRPGVRLTRRRVVVTLAVLAALFLVYTLAGFFLVPRLIATYVPRYAQERLGRRAHIGEVRINPLLFKVDIRQFRLQEADGRPLLGFDRLFVDFELTSVFRAAWTFAEIRLEAPRVDAVMGPDGRLNIAELLDALPKGEPAPVPAASTGRLDLRGFPLATAWRFVQENIAVAEPTGQLDANLRYQFAYRDGATSLKVDGVEVAFTGLTLKERASKAPLLAVDRMDVIAARGDVIARELIVPEVSLSRGRVAATLARDGSVNW